MKPDEKKFLHDIMSPLAGMSMLIESLQEDLPVDPQWASVHERLKAVSDGLEKVRSSVLARQTQAPESDRKEG